MADKPKFDQRKYINDYKRENYTNLSAWVKKGVAQRFRLRLKERNETVSTVFHAAIDDYLRDDGTKNK